MKLFVLSGATIAFNELVAAFDARLVEFLNAAGYTEIVIQYGHAGEAFAQGPAKLPGVSGFDFKVNILDYIKSADMVITHAGTGSILDVLRNVPGKPLVVVVNKTLMDNHQTDVARELQDKQLLVSDVDAIKDTLHKALHFQFQPLPEAVSLQSTIEHELLVAKGVPLKNQ